MNRIFYFFIFILGITSNLHAVEPFTVTDEVACLPLLNHLEYYEDTEGKLSITEIANQSFQWRPVNTDSINIGISQSAHWFRFSIENKQKSVKELYLNLTSGFINYVNFYLSQETDTFQKISAGNKLPSSTQDIASKNFVFRIPADPGYHTYYLRIQSNNPIIFEMQICSPEAYIEKTTQELPLLWIYFGMMLALAIYNLFYFVSVRQVIYLYCFALIALNALSRYYLTGFGFQYLWPDSIWFQSRASYLFDTGAMFFTSCYYRSLFRTRAKYPIFEKLLLWISLFPAPLLLVVFSVLEPRQVMPIALIIWIFLNLIIYLLLLIHAAMKKSRQATIILFGFSVAFIFYFNVMLKIFGFSVVNVTTAMGLSIGDVIHSIFLSFALADTINTMKKKLVNLNRALNESQKNYRLISENISDVISIIDLKDLKFKYVSPSIQRVLGYTSTEILGSSIDKVLPAKLFNEFNHNFNQFLTLQKEGNWDFNEPTIVVFKINRKDGNAIWIEVVSNIVQWNGVEYGGLLAITRDITARKQAEEEIKKLNLELEERVKARTEELRQAVAHAQKLARKAEAANIEKSRFLANMSHEIRTPMNGVIGFTDMLLDTELTDDQLDYIKTIKRSGESLLFLINDILDFSKIESGELDFEEIDFDPELLAYDVCELVRPKIVSKPIELLCHIHDQLPHVVKGDPLRFRQVLTNLLGNAPKFTEQGEIELSLTIEDETEDEVKLHTFIRDTGIGIAQDKLQSIFDPFQQADDSTTRKYGGTGLGLSICRKIAVMMK
ncbi:MAG: 7TM-DISM domain-containing protein, partial [Desulfobacteraceae bacterium]